MPNPAVFREYIEWCDIWVRAADESSTKPRALFIGDSITRGLYPVAERLLAAEAECARVCTSRFLTDPVFFQELALVLGQCRFAAIHFNNGLHGWDFSEEQYRAGLPVLVQFLRERQPGARLAWAQSTRVRNPAKPAEPRGAQPGNGPDNARVLARNRIAAAVMAEQGVPVNDLYTLTAERPELFSPDGVHYLAEGNEALGAQAAQQVRSLLAG